MPIIIDPNAKDFDKQVKDMKNVIALNKQVDAKYFSTNFTGSSKRKAGLFGRDLNTIDDFLKNSRRLLGHIQTNNAKNSSIAYLQSNSFGNQFHKKTKIKEKDFRQFENNLTTMIPPVFLYSIIEENIALSFPKASNMYNIDVLEDVWTKISTGLIDGKKATVYALPIVQSIRLNSREIVSGSGSTISGTIQVAGEPDIYIALATVLNDMDQSGDLIFTNMVGKNVNENQGVISIIPLVEYNSISYDYRNIFLKFDKHLNQTITNKHNTIPTTPQFDIQQLLGEQSISDILESQAMSIAHHASDTLLGFVETLSKRYKELKIKIDKGKYSKNDTLPLLTNSFIGFVEHLDNLNDFDNETITTDLLSEIFEHIKEGIGDTLEVNNIARHSLRLLLSQRLHELDDICNSGGLYEFKPNDKTVNDDMAKNRDYSTQQKKIITSTDPLVIGQAGAGSGKSHTLIGRINHLRNHGEELNKILVLSFTNVSALNINNRFPEVRSETLANMFNTIYKATYPAQQLSQPSTVANAIRLVNPASSYFKNLGVDKNELIEFIHSFAVRLEQFDQTGFKRVNLQQELKRMANLIEENLELTTIVLNAVEQTTLELQPIIIHHKLLLGATDLNIPKEYRDLNYIITDESQDISTFEYILLLELTIHYRSQLLIIGDGSQTLYEFRNSDPRYMNALESSNVFISHKLETNYRSNEEILMYANQFLKVIDANKFAKIQLQSALFTKPTRQTIDDMIKVRDNEMFGTSAQDYIESLKKYLQTDDEFQEWFLGKIKKGERVAIMGWTRKEVLATGEEIETLLKDNGLGHIEVTNIMSDNERPMIILSRFARVKNETLRSLDPLNPQYLSEIDRHVEDFVKKTFPKSSYRQNAFYNDFINNNIKEIVQSQEWSAWKNDLRSGKIQKYQIGSFLIQQMLRLETRKNSMDQYLKKQKEVPNYDECPVILSTIHGTKGLEFDNTLILFNESKRGSTSQESLRMMFVALSRAKKAEFIINTHRATPTRSVSNTHGGMFQTPMQTAYLRALGEVDKL